MAKENSNNASLFKRLSFALSLALVVMILWDLTPIGGTLAFYHKWISCDQKPVVSVGSGFMNAGTAHYEEPPSINIFPGAQDYYCTPIEAERAGYSAEENSRVFPNLEKACEPIPLTNGGVRYPNGKEVLWNGSILFPEGTEDGRRHVQANCPDYTQE